MIGRPYTPTDVDSEFCITHLLGREVRAESEKGSVRGILADVYTDGTAAIEGYNGLIAAIVPAESVKPA